MIESKRERELHGVKCFSKISGVIPLHGFVFLIFPDVGTV